MVPHYPLNKTATRFATKIIFLKTGRLDIVITTLSGIHSNILCTLYALWRSLPSVLYSPIHLLVCDLPSGRRRIEPFELVRVECMNTSCSFGKTRLVANIAVVQHHPHLFSSPVARSPFTVSTPLPSVPYHAHHPAFDISFHHPSVRRWCPQSWGPSTRSTLSASIVSLSVSDHQLSLACQFP